MASPGPPVFCLHEFFYLILFLFPKSDPALKAGDTVAGRSIATGRVTMAPRDAVMQLGAWEGVISMRRRGEGEDGHNL